MYTMNRKSYKSEYDVKDRYVDSHLPEKRLGRERNRN